MQYQTDPEYQRILKIRKAALECGLKYYFTGVACKRGHIAERYTLGRNCVECNARLEHRKRVRFQNRNITEEEYLEMLWQQGGKCAICKNNLEKGQNQGIDHCHTTNKIRGILCRWCNAGLGNFKDDAEALENASKYIRKYNAT